MLRVLTSFVIWIHLRTDPQQSLQDVYYANDNVMQLRNNEYWQHLARLVACISGATQSVQRR